jgi:hypothetical protein
MLFFSEDTMRLSLFLLLFLPIVAVRAAPGDTADETAAIVRECRENEEKVAAMIVQAEKEKDIRWKLCLGDAAVTLRGVAASAETAAERRGDLIAAGKNDGAAAQAALLRGLGDASRRALLDAQNCRRQLTQVIDGQKAQVERDTAKLGPCGSGEGVNDALCIGFLEDMVTEREKGMKGDDPLDGGGSDQIGGPYETPATPGGSSDSVNDHTDQISVPPFPEASPER